MKTILTFLFALCTFFSMAQKQAYVSPAWSPIMDSTGTEIIMDGKYLIYIIEEKATLDDAMKAEIDSWLSSMSSASKVDRGVVVSKNDFVDHKEVYGKTKEVARKNSLKGDWIVVK